MTVEWADQLLFDPGPPALASAPLGEDAARTRRRNSMLAAGTHPTTGARLREEGGHCWDCAHLVEDDSHRRTYWKCGKVFMTHGPATDVRLKWPACTLWEPKS